jgi:hypothetical protein
MAFLKERENHQKLISTDIQRKNAMDPGMFILIGFGSQG